MASLWLRSSKHKLRWCFRVRSGNPDFFMFDLSRLIENFLLDATLCQHTTVGFLRQRYFWMSHRGLSRPTANLPVQIRSLHTSLASACSPVTIYRLKSLLLHMATSGLAERQSLDGYARYRPMEEDEAALCRFWGAAAENACKSPFLLAILYDRGRCSWRPLMTRCNIMQNQWPVKTEWFWRKSTSNNWTRSCAAHRWNQRSKLFRNTLVSTTVILFGLS